MTLSKDQILALHNLAAKEAGDLVGWINISDAMALTELGLARRNRAGWEITLDGACLLQDLPAESRPTTESGLIPFRRLH
jgi:hypothetical protein